MILVNPACDQNAISDFANTQRCSRIEFSLRTANDFHLGFRNQSCQHRSKVENLASEIHISAVQPKRTSTMKR